MAISRERAWDLLKRYNSELMHLSHALAVEACMKFFAQQAGEDPQFWGTVGLLHDLDWEMTQSDPARHTSESDRILEAEGVDEATRHAIRSHGWGICSATEPTSPMEWTLYTIDELTGLVIATALVRPSRSLDDLTAKSVKKKWKDKAFAAGVNRDVIASGAERMGKPVDELMTSVIEALRPVQSQLGLTPLAN